MKFIVKVFSMSEEEAVVSGYFRASDKDEEELLQVMVAVFEEIEVYSNKLASNEKTLLFKSVKLKTLLDSLQFIQRELEVPIEIVISHNLVGDSEELMKQLEKSQ